MSRFERRRRPAIRTRSILMIMSLCLMVVSVVGGSLAWLTAKTDPVTNVFTYGNITITLDETDRDYKMVPGKDLDKDPKLTVVKDSEDCWLFIKIEESTNAKLSDYISYTVADGWTALDNVAGVYYRAVTSSTADQVFEVLKDNKVTVKTTVTSEMLKSLTNQTNPTLTFTGYAVQKADIDGVRTAAEAWTLISGI